MLFQPASSTSPTEMARIVQKMISLIRSINSDSNKATGYTPQNEDDRYEIEFSSYQHSYKKKPLLFKWLKKVISRSARFLLLKSFVNILYKIPDNF